MKKRLRRKIAKAIWHCPNMAYGSLLAEWIRSLSAQCVLKRAYAYKKWHRKKFGNEIHLGSYFTERN